MKKSVFLAYLDSGRIGNLPSVISHVLVGVLISWIAPYAQLKEVVLNWDAELIIWALSGACFIYLFGTFLGDAYDVEWDRKHKPERPTVTGLISGSSLYVGAIIFLALGVGCFFKTGRIDEVLVPLSILVGAILVYTYIHKRSAWGCVPMGICRATLPWIGFLLFSGEFTGQIAYLIVSAQSFAAFFYVMGLTLVARQEKDGDLPLIKQILPSICFLVPGFWLGFAQLPLVMFSVTMGLAGAFLFQGFCFYSLRRLNVSIGSFVNHALIGMALLDLPIAMAFFSADLPLSYLAFTPVVAVVLSLLLGKIAKNT